MIRLKFSSRAPADFVTLLKALAPGLLKDELDVTSNGERLSAPTIIEVVKTYEPDGTEIYRPVPPAQLPAGDQPGADQTDQDAGE
jgi:hypothetical protein